MKKSMRSKYFFIVIAFACLTSFSADAQPAPDVSVSRIWDGAGHNAFPDLISYQNAFYCAFREGAGHIPNKSAEDGMVRILRSKDGKNWTSIALLKKDGIDLRDPKLSITPSGKLMVIIGGSVYTHAGKRELKGRIPHVSFSNSAGKKFSEPEKVTIDPAVAPWGDWIWRVTWQGNTGYGMDYQIGPEERNGPTNLYLLKTKNGKTFEKVSKVPLDGFPNETTLRFDKAGTVYALTRRETGDQMGVLAKSKPPYTEWEQTKLKHRLGGPNFLFKENGEMIMGSRVYTATGAYTAFFKGDGYGQFTEVVKLPSSGDNSYPGMLIYKNDLWTVYYSSHEGKTSIYFAKIPLSYF
jgi:hypothetical protein